MRILVNQIKASKKYKYNLLNDLDEVYRFSVHLEANITSINGNIIKEH